MKLICQTRLMPWERNFVYSPEQAPSLMQPYFRPVSRSSGLKQLHRSLPLGSEFKVSNTFRRRDWRLIRDEAYCFDWKTFDKGYEEQKFARTIAKLMAEPPLQPTKKPFEFRVIDSETTEPMSRRKCNFYPDDTLIERKTDNDGLTYLSLHAAPDEMCVRLPG